MKIIKLSQIRGKNKNRFALIDDEDYELLNKDFWCIHSSGYSWNSKKEYMHRKIMSPPKGMVVDHINGNKLDNRKENLRVCTQRQNTQNQKKRKNLTGYKGISKHYFSNSYGVESRIYKNGKRIYIGFFKSEIHAAMAYDIWAKDLFGEFANLNFNSLGKE